MRQFPERRFEEPRHGRGFSWTRSGVVLLAYIDETGEPGAYVGPDEGYSQHLSKVL